jgi:hypothetical protein
MYLASAHLRRTHRTLFEYLELPKMWQQWAVLLEHWEEAVILMYEQ